MNIRPEGADPPDPAAARTLDDLVERLRRLKVWAGDPSYDTITTRVNAAVRSGRAVHSPGRRDPRRPAVDLAKRNTIADCFKSGRRRLNADLVLAVVEALHPDVGYVAQWRQVLRVVLAETRAAGQVRAQDVLPADIGEFTGRDAHLDRLRDGAVAVAVIEGMAGVGKTQLVVRAGHALARDHPFDHVLFVDLRGFHPDPAQPPADPAAVLDGFLRLLGVAGHDIPHEMGARIAAYRERLAGKRALVVLDNAADEQQVAPLLPDRPGCVTLITSRRRLSGLDATVRLPVEVFTPDEALTFLSRAAAGVESGPDSEAAARVARSCGYLPLALGLVAGHMRVRSEWTMTDHADRLDERHRTRRLDDAVDLALGLSYQHLPADRQRLVRLLALHPGIDLDAYAAAALADTDLPTATAQLTRLADDHLLQRSAPGRFVFHDLVRAFAMNRAVDDDRPPQRRAALTRLFDAYRYAASVAMDAVHPPEHDSRPHVERPATPVPPLDDAATARAWLDTERANLVSVAGHAAAYGWPEHTTDLAQTLFRYLDAGHYGAAVTLYTYARTAARDSGDRAAEAAALNNLSIVYQRLGRHQEAVDDHRTAIELYRELGDESGEARGLAYLGNANFHLGRYAEAADNHRAALALFRRLDHAGGIAGSLGNLGHVYTRWGRHEQAADCYEQTLELFRANGDRFGEAHALDDLGAARLKLNRHAEAVDLHLASIEAYREVGDPLGEAHALNNLGVAYRLLGRHDDAAARHEQAIAIFREIGNPMGEAEGLNDLGATVLAGGRPAQARTHHAAALAAAVGLDDRYEQARAHSGLARCHLADGDADQARHHWKHAESLYTELGVPEAEEVRADLDAID